MGQNLYTPMGLGQVTAIYPERGMLQIKLSYGIMYANVITVVGWGEVDASTDETLCQRWSDCEKSLTMPKGTHHGIRELLEGITLSTFSFDTIFFACRATYPKLTNYG